MAFIAFSWPLNGAFRLKQHQGQPFKCSGALDFAFVGWNPVTDQRAFNPFLLHVVHLSTFSLITHNITALSEFNPQREKKLNKRKKKTKKNSLSKVDIYLYLDYNDKRKSDFLIKSF